MVLLKGEHLDEFPENFWYPEFSTLRTLNDKTTLRDVKSLGDKVYDGEEVGIFFTDSGDEDSPREFEVLTRFCRGTCLEDVISGKGTAGELRVVWVDERTSSPAKTKCKLARPHENPLTATGLYRALDKARFDHEQLSDASRRLMYFSDLSPACIWALAATISSHHAAGLRDAIYKYLEFQTSIAVQITTAGLLSFQLDFHLPFFILSRSPPPLEELGKINIKPRRRWTDLSFLNLDNLDSNAEGLASDEIWGIQEAQISFAVAGYDDWRWIGYGFVDSEVDGILAQADEQDLQFDQIAALKLDSNKPIQKPRDYWIKILEIRILYVKRKWNYLVHKLKLGVDQYMKKYPLTLSRRSRTAQERASQVEKAFDVNSEMMEVLSQIGGVLSETIKAWKSFNSYDSHMGFFRTTEDAAISNGSKRSLHAIKVIFQEMEGDHNKIMLLKQKCSEFSSTLKLRLILENKAAADQNGKITEFTVSVLYPPALAAAIFSMQQSAVPFELTPRAFGFSLATLFIMVYAIRFVSRHILPHFRVLQEISAVWFKNRNLNGKAHTIADIELGEIVADISTDRIVIGEETNEPRACGTRALLGPGDEE